MSLSAERQSVAGPEIRLQAALVRTADWLRPNDFGQRCAGGSGRRLQTGRTRYRFGCNPAGISARTNPRRQQTEPRRSAFRASVLR